MDHTTQKPSWTILCMNPWGPSNSSTLEDHAMDKHLSTILHKLVLEPSSNGAGTIQHHTTHEPSRTILCKNPIRPTDTRALKDYAMHEPSRTIRCKSPWPKTHVKIPWLAFNAKNLKDHASLPLETIQQKIPCEQHNTNILEDHTAQVLLRTRPHKNLETKLCKNHWDQYYKGPYKDHGMQDPYYLEIILCKNPQGTFDTWQQKNPSGPLSKAWHNNLWGQYDTCTLEEHNNTRSVEEHMTQPLLKMKDCTMPEPLPVRIWDKTSWGPCTAWSLDYSTTQEPFSTIQHCDKKPWAQ